MKIGMKIVSHRLSQHICISFLHLIVYYDSFHGSYGKRQICDYIYFFKIKNRSKKNTLYRALIVFKMAERGRFELPVGYPTHPFQGCALGHYATSPYNKLPIYMEKSFFCKGKLS